MDLARRHNATYTRYAVDMTFSFYDGRLPDNVCSFDSGVLVLGDELHEIIHRHSFRINESKSRISSRRHRLEVTGLTINDFPNVPRAFIDRIRGALNAWEAHGYDKAQAEWLRRTKSASAEVYERQVWKRQWRSPDRYPELKEVIRGKLLYVHMVRGANDALFVRLAERYNALCEREKKSGAFSCRTLPVEAIVRTEKDAEEATFVVEWTADVTIPSTGQKDVAYVQGTAFAYGGFGLITCDHVLRYGEVDIESEVALTATLTIIRPKTGEKWQAHIVRRHAHLDIALLQFNEAEPPKHRHFVGMKSPIKRNEEGFLIGFPNFGYGKPLNVIPRKVLTRYAKSGVDCFDIDGVIRKGNSGGPFVDSAFQVAGVARQGAVQHSGNDECLCVSVLDQWLSEGAKGGAPNPTAEATKTGGELA
jgi:RNA-directed DNA polymerase